MIPVLLILIPLLAGLVTFFIKDEKMAKGWSFFASVITLLFAVAGLTFLKDAKYLSAQCEWLPALGTSFSVKLDGMGQLLCLLNALAYPLILLATWNNQYKKAKNFFALMLLGQAGMMGVFVAMDALVFYFFWELALIPMYFLCSQWGGEKRIAVTFKFFIYTFLGSLLMLIGILYVYGQTSDHSFDIRAFYNVVLSNKQQSWLFWLFFIAFAIKMPVFPFHTWQPDTYEQAPTATTMVLSGVMVKMGLVGVIRWLMPVLPAAGHEWGDIVMSLSVIGIVYASLIAIRQDDIKRLLAYSSIAHMGLMCMAVFAENYSGLQGVMIQMFNHGINIIGLWILADIIERRYGTRKLSGLGGLAQQAPTMAIFFVIIALASIALPLTNAFAGEFLMFNSLLSAKTSYLYAILFMVFAGLGIIFGAVYTLNMIRRIFYGEHVVLSKDSSLSDLRLHEKVSLGVIVVLIFVIGVYPQIILDVTSNISELIFGKMYKPGFK
jgi:NADH-quinone oxidoreductase subunit M